MKSLITGGAGFIGSHLADELIRRGDEVRVLDDLSTGYESNLAVAVAGGATLAAGDVCDRGFVDSQISAFAPDRVFHLAAQVDVRKANADPQLDARINVLGTVNLLEAVHAAGDVPFVFAATGGAVYGEGDGARLPFQETAAPAPETAYGVSKLAGESYVALFRRLHGVPGLALRLGNIYGPRQDPHGEAGVVAIFCGRLLEREDPTIFGDGRQSRDYVYVDDAVRALTAAADALASRGTSIEGPLNVGTGAQTSVLELLETLARLAGVAVEPLFAPPRLGEVQSVAIDPAAAGRELGWSAQESLEEGLSRTLSFVQEQRRR